ncbi:MAG TPA: ATP-binding protein [Herpetosiphonaceae bacterium]
MIEQDLFHIVPAHMEQGPYTRSEQHLWDALRRIDQLIRVQTLHWRLTLGATKSDDMWGMILVTDAEVQAFLEHSFLPPGHLSDEERERIETRRAQADALEQLITNRVRETPSAVFLRLDALEKMFGLTSTQRDLLLVCLLAELDGRYRRLFGYLQDDASRTRPTVELALRIVLPPNTPSEAGYAALDNASPLVAQRLLLLSSSASGAEPFSMRSLRVEDRIAAYLVGNGDPATDESLDARVHTIATLDGAPQVRHCLDTDLIAEFAAWWPQRTPQTGCNALFLHGSFGSGRRATARAICDNLGMPLIIADAARLLDTQDWQQAIDLIYREALLRGAALYWSHVEVLLDTAQPPERRAYLVAAAERFARLSFFAGSAPWELTTPGDTQPALRIDFRPPSHDQRRDLWQHYLPQAAEFVSERLNRHILAEQLASSFRFTEGQIVDAVAAARMLARAHSPLHGLLKRDDIFEACRRQSSARLTLLAQRIEPRPGGQLEDVKLPPKYAAQLTELWNRIEFRNDVYATMGFEQQLSLGKGLVALFTGPSGTGKTMAAERLASKQGVDLYKIDLSAVVSKYVGETEKNLSRVFAEAEDANAVLFFDEADALFGKRGEVKEAQDRWANIETNYLLQRIEEYDGVVILTSNLRQNIDEAFLRRIHVIVEFPLPDETRRIEIWHATLPHAVAPAPEAIEELARQFRLTGGNIKNIALDAAFRACAAQERRISKRHLVAGIAREYEKLGRPITKGEFGEQFYAWAEQDVLNPRAADHAGQSQK